MESDQHVPTRGLRSQHVHGASHGATTTIFRALLCRQGSVGSLRDCDYLEEIKAAEDGDSTPDHLLHLVLQQQAMTDCIWLRMTHVRRLTRAWSLIALFASGSLPENVHLKTAEGRILHAEQPPLKMGSLQSSFASICSKVTMYIAVWLQALLGSPDASSMHHLQSWRSTQD